MSKNSPMVSEFETDQQERDYTRWLKAKVAARLADSRAIIPHDDVMAEMEAIIATAENDKTR
ncbi:hypothetical protein [Zavarzinia sp.]|uniref:type II toxin-antitoxin system RelB family antitoxin n=1 Tax=Zavarzinia sp. TaxID=2027920 RepID=UPI003BB7AB65|nr:antitoxin [Zavarzinia sp.]